MKRLYITLMAAFTAVMSFAQNTPPSNAKQEQWWIESTFNYQENGEPAQLQVSEDIIVAFSGDDIYFYFPNPWGENSWIKGTKDSESGAYVFGRGQQVGNYGGMYYFSGYDGENFSDYSFYYSEATNSYSCLGYMMISSSTTDVSTTIGYFESTTISASKPVPDELVQAPENLQTQDYVLSGTSINYAQDGSISSMDNIAFSVKVGFEGNNVYIQGLSQAEPSAWAKGTLNDGDVTFEMGQFMGKVSSFSSYLMGQQYGTKEISNLEFEYDSTTGAFTARQYMVINAYKATLAPFAVYAEVSIKKAAAETPANPSVSNYTPYSAAEGYGTLELNIPLVSETGTALASDKMSYQLYKDINGEVTDYVFTKDDYIKLEESMVEIPYDYTDNYDIAVGGAYISIFENSMQFKRIGVQSIYRVGNEEKRSGIVWYTIPTDGINDIRRSESDSVSYNMAGQKVGNNYRGLVIRNGKKLLRR